MDELKAFTIRAYGKTELARLYLPDNTPGSALQAFMRWIKGDKELLENLQATGFHKFQKGFTPKQVRILIDYFEAPPGYVEL